MTLPTLFLSHGAPTLAIQKTAASEFLKSLAAHVPAPQALFVVSAHWEEAKPTLGLGTDTIHDFYGFPPALYQMAYQPAPARDVAARAATLLRAADVPVSVNDGRGRDHGVWIPLMLAWPHADVPVAQLSLVASADPEVHFAIGRALKPLRDEGVLIIGSGSAMHNLRARPTSQPAEWATSFADWLDRTLDERDDAVLQDWRRAAPSAEINHPSAEHFDPIFVARGGGRGFAQAASVVGVRIPVDERVCVWDERLHSSR
jgi:4,5-DOPA dioxygenase extradiol